MKQFLTILTITAALGFATSAHASLPGDTISLRPTNNTLTSIDRDPANLLAQCYSGGYSSGYLYDYAPVRPRHYQGYRGGSGISVRVGGGYGYPVYRSGYRGYGNYRRGYYGPGARYGYGPRSGRGGVGLYLSF